MNFVRPNCENRITEQSDNFQSTARLDLVQNTTANRLIEEVSRRDLHSKLEIGSRLDTNHF